MATGWVSFGWREQWRLLVSLQYLFYTNIQAVSTKGSKQVLRPAEGSPENFLSLCKNCLFNSNSQFTHLCLTLMFVKLNTCSALRHEKFNTCISVLNHQRELNLFLICQGYCFYFGLTKVYIQHFCYCSEM